MKEVAEHLSMGLRTVEKMIADRTIPPEIVRRPRNYMVRIDRKGLEDWMSSQGGDK
jgi:excisionase family DNA binding protein